MGDGVSIQFTYILHVPNDLSLLSLEFSHNAQSNCWYDLKCRLWICLYHMVPCAWSAVQQEILPRSAAIKVGLFGLVLA